MSRSEADSAWQPSCTLDALRLRAKVLSAIRRFFDGRGVLEVETPLLAHTAGTDPNLHPFDTRFLQPGQAEGSTLYLQTSPEFAMKRLLAWGSGSIYQICKSFRNEECGRLHNPEFSLLEWYRVGFGLGELMDEIEALFQCLFEGGLPVARRVAYRDLFGEMAGADPLNASLAEFAACATRHGLADAQRLCGEDRNVWLDLLFSHLVQPRMAPGRVYLVYDYPACLPSLARKKPGNPDLVARVEVFLDGVELGNGYHELGDALEQEQRFDAELALRWQAGLPLIPKDRRLLNGLACGLPDCAGMAIGLDRLLLRLLAGRDIAQVLAFPVGRA